MFKKVSHDQAKRMIVQWYLRGERFQPNLEPDDEFEEGPSFGEDQTGRGAPPLVVDQESVTE